MADIQCDVAVPDLSIAKSYTTPTATTTARNDAKSTTSTRLDGSPGPSQISSGDKGLNGELIQARFNRLLGQCDSLCGRKFVHLLEN